MKKVALLGFLLIISSVSLFAWSVFSKSTNLGVTDYTIQCDNGHTVHVSQAGDRYSSSGYNSGSIQTFGSLSSAVSHACND